MNNSYTKYSAWKESNNFRQTIKSKLDFLLKNSVDLYDFNEKAKALDLEIDISGKYTTYKLKGANQKEVYGIGHFRKMGSIILIRLKND